jgi:hypothetical protein
MATAGTCSIVPDFSQTGACVRTAGTPRSPEPVTITGNPTGATNIRIRITSTTAGTAVGEARFQWSSDGGLTWSAETVTPSGGILNSATTPPSYVAGGQQGLGSTGLSVRFLGGSVIYAVGDQWSFTLAHAVGFPVVAGTGFAAELAAVEAALWWAPVSGTFIALPDVYAGIDTRTNFQTMYVTACATLAARCNALAAVFAPRLGGS